MVRGQCTKRRASHLLLDLDLELAFQNLHQIVLAAGIEHPVPDAALVPGHGINEDCETRGGGGRRGAGGGEGGGALKLESPHRKKSGWLQNSPVDSR